MRSPGIQKGSALDNSLKLTPRGNTPKADLDVRSPSSGKKRQQRRQSSHKENIISSPSNIKSPMKTPVSLESPLTRSSEQNQNVDVADVSIRV